MRYLFIILAAPIFSLAYHERLNPEDSSFRHNHRHHHNSLTGAVKKAFARHVEQVLIANRIYMIIAKLLIWLRLESGVHQKRDCLFFIDNGPKRDINASALARRLLKDYGVSVHEWAAVAIKAHPDQKIVYFGCARVAIYGDACIFATNFWAATKIASEWHKNGFRYTPHSPHLHMQHNNH